jgi:hypothetical protein
MPCSNQLHISALLFMGTKVALAVFTVLIATALADWSTYPTLNLVVLYSMLVVCSLYTLVLIVLTIYHHVKRYRMRSASKAAAGTKFADSQHTLSVGLLSLEALGIDTLTLRQAYLPPPSVATICTVQSFYQEPVGGFLDK